jgi:ureidoacrylate peracid hydrolase
LIIRRRAVRDERRVIIEHETVARRRLHADVGRDAKNCLKGTWGAEFTGIGPLNESEPVVIKHRYSAFLNTRLDSILRTLKVENIVVLGVATNVCVESTSRHGFMLDYHTTFVSDCSAAYNQAAHDMTLKTHAKHFGQVATAQQIIDAWTATHSVAASA